ncbi:MAG: nitrate reductase cytochrome c-type subunit [Planctomycetes bacterium]|nr:nitrate reductase cytochrome c-type subunit [Planctomycetota bacterium]MBI3845692.1 nitrate reductase cytochrome c-type subunit [Planctomycetota bacterium]
MNRILLVAGVACVLAACRGAGPKPTSTDRAEPLPVATPDSSLGISKTSVFDTPAPVPVHWVDAEPGKGQLQPREFVGAPPVISHGLADLLPITRDENSCVTCHKVKQRKPGEPTPIPDSHFVDWRNAPGVKREEVAGARWVCTSCHVAQARVTPPVAND